MKLEITRRQFHFLLGAGMIAASGIRSVEAAPGGKLVIGFWGGDAQKLLEELITNPILGPKAIKSMFDPAAEPPRKVKLLAERALPRGTFDIVGLSSSGSFEMWKSGALLDLDLQQIPTSGRILPQLKRGYAIPQYYTTRVILYNPEKVTKKPEGYVDLWDPSFAGKVGLVDIQYQSTIESAALVAGGSTSNYEPGKQKLLELKAMGAKVYPTNEALAQALKSGECWICIMWQSRGVNWQRAGIPVEIAFPKEGLALSIYDFAVPKNSRNKDNAYAFLEASLTESVQKQSSERFFYVPPIEGVKLDEGLLKAISVPKGMENQLLTPDDEYLRANDAELKSWWDKVFKA